MSAAFDEAFDFDAFDLDVTGAAMSVSDGVVTACSLSEALVTACAASAEALVTAADVTDDLTP